MADKPKGNIFFEIAIVILAIALMATILYPKRVWQQEDTLELVCHVRMEAIKQLELQYINKVWTYTDSLEKLKEVVLADEAAVAAIDSTINWDKMIEGKDLKQIILAASFPEDLRRMISGTLEAGKPLRNLAKWDGLEYKLIDELEKKLAAGGGIAISAIDNGVLWPELFGERMFQVMIDNIPQSVQEKSRVQQQLRKGMPIQETGGWAKLYPVFYSKLAEIIQTAKRTDVWEKKDQDAWKKVKRAEWETGLDALNPAAQDSLWSVHERALWDKIREVVWKQDRDGLWKKEKDTWPVENESMWRRNVNQQWEIDRKKEWVAKQEKSIPNDSVLTVFKANRDSLWRTASVSIRDAEFTNWERQNKKYIADVIEGLWESDKKMEWEEGAHQRWIEKKNADKAARWIELKEELWNAKWPEFWKVEEEKLDGKKNSLRRIDLAVKWNAVVGRENTDTIVQNLSLPTAEKAWQKVTEKTEEKGSGLYRSGLVGLFRPALIDSVDLCPVARVPYLIHVMDTSTIKKVGVRCPIEITTTLAIGKYKAPVSQIEQDVLLVEDAPFSSDTLKTTDSKLVVEEVPAASGKTFTVALSVDPATKDTSKVVMKIPTSQKLFGGGSIRPHGFIDIDGKKSWEKKGR